MIRKPVTVEPESDHDRRLRAHTIRIFNNCDRHWRAMVNISADWDGGYLSVIRRVLLREIKTRDLERIDACGFIAANTAAFVVDCNPPLARMSIKRRTALVHVMMAEFVTWASSELDPPLSVAERDAIAAGVVESNFAKYFWPTKLWRASPAERAASTASKLRRKPGCTRNRSVGLPGSH